MDEILKKSLKFNVYAYTETKLGENSTNANLKLQYTSHNDYNIFIFYNIIVPETYMNLYHL